MGCGCLGVASPYDLMSGVLRSAGGGQVPTTTIYQAVPVTAEATSALSEWLDFIAAIAGFLAAIAWPVVLLIIISMFREQIGRKIDAIQWFKGPVEMGWTQEAQTLEAKAEVLQAITGDADLKEVDDTVAAAGVESDAVGTAGASSPVLTQTLSVFENIVQDSPSAAVLFMWKIVESRIRELAALNGIATGFDLSLQPLIRHLELRHFISSTVAELIQDLRKLRNQAVHLPTLSETDARAFERTAWVVIQALDRAISDAEDLNNDSD